MRILQWLRTRRRLKLRQQLATATLLALCVTTYAFAAHVHVRDRGNSDGSDQICALCLHFERIGTTPTLVVFAFAPATPDHVVAVRDIPAPRPAGVRPYQSRAPPLPF